MGENFSEFGDLLQIHQRSFIRQLLVISEKAIGAGLKSAKVFFAKCNIACYSPKFSPAKIFRYTVSCALSLHQSGSPWLPTVQDNDTYTQAVNQQFTYSVLVYVAVIIGL